MINLGDFTIEDLALIVLDQIALNRNQNEWTSGKFEVFSCEGKFVMVGLDRYRKNPVLLARGPMKINRDY